MVLAKWQGNICRNINTSLGSYAKTAQVDSLMLKMYPAAVPIPILQGSKVRELLMQQNHRKTQGSMKALLSSLQGVTWLQLDSFMEKSLNTAPS